MTMEPGRHTGEPLNPDEVIDPTTQNPIVELPRASFASSDSDAKFAGGTPRERLQRLAAAYSRGQKVGAALAVAVVVLAVMLLVRSANKTEWGALYTDVAPADGGAIIAALDEQGIPHQLASGGATIMIPKDMIYDTRMKLADTDLPTSGKVGYGVLDNQGLTTSEFGQRIGFKRAMEGELAKTIQSIASVETAVVHLALPENQVFALQEQKPSASVLIKTRPGGVSEDQVRAIVNLVASSIEGMTPDQVTVADSAGSVLAAPGQGVTAPSGGGNRQRQTDEFESAIEKSLNDLLVSVVGPGGSRVSVNAVLDFDQTTVSKETFEKPDNGGGTDPLVIEESKRDETFTGVNPQTGGVLGPDTPAVAGADGNSDYTLNEGDVRYALNRAVESSTKAPGSIQQLSVAVIVDQSRITAGEADQLTQTLAAGANIRAERGDVLTVSRLPFDESVAKANEAEIKRVEAERRAAEKKAFNPWPIAAGLVLILVSGAIAYRRFNRGSDDATNDPSISPLEAGDQPDALSPVAAAMITEADNGDVLDIAAGPDHELGAAEEDIPAVVEVIDPLEQARIEREESLGNLIDSQPDEVAALLRGWLADRRGTARR